jgi:hypothetical protein
MALPAGWAWPNGRLRQRVRPTADPRGRGSLIFGDSRLDARAPGSRQTRDGDRPPAFKPNVTLGRVSGQKWPRTRVSHTGMVEDRIGWKPSLVGRPIPVALISQTAQRRPCCGTHSIRAFDRREALHHRRPAKIRIVGEREICGFDFFSHTGSRSGSGATLLPK